MSSSESESESEASATAATSATSVPGDPADVATTAPTTAPTPSSPTSTEDARDQPTGTALAVLDTLEVKGRAPKTGYSREQFGNGWVDSDRNGCDTRNDTLARDLEAETFKPGTRDCVVLTGTLADPYSGTALSFARGQATSSAVQIDHVVALSDAWQKGAQAWDTAKRVAFANDDLELLAVDGPLNEQKSDGDAATWLPPNKAYRCAYVARQVAVKASWGLWVTTAERATIANVLSSCPDEPIPTAASRAGGIAAGNGSNVAPTPTVSTTASPPVQATSPPSVVVEPRPTSPGKEADAGEDPDMGTCKAAKAAGYGPYVQGTDHEYTYYRDADHDGIVCE